jgi:hypothetical protein
MFNDPMITTPDLEPPADALPGPAAAKGLIGPSGAAWVGAGIDNGAAGGKGAGLAIALGLKGPGKPPDGRCFTGNAAFGMTDFVGCACDAAGGCALPDRTAALGAGGTCLDAEPGAGRGDFFLGIERSESAQGCMLATPAHCKGIPPGTKQVTAQACAMLRGTRTSRLAENSPRCRAACRQARPTPRRQSNRFVGAAGGTPQQP